MKSLTFLIVGIFFAAVAFGCSGDTEPASSDKPAGDAASSGKVESGDKPAPGNAGPQAGPEPEKPPG